MYYTPLLVNSGLAECGAAFGDAMRCGVAVWPFGGVAVCVDGQESRVGAMAVISMQSASVPLISSRRT